MALGTAVLALQQPAVGEAVPQESQQRAKPHPALLIVGAVLIAIVLVGIVVVLVLSLQSKEDETAPGDLGPLDQFEKHIYGHAMPQGHRNEHLEFYRRHNQAVRDHFADRPGKLLELCWERGDGPDDLGQFLGVEGLVPSPVHANRSMKVYSGNSRWLAELNRVGFQSWWKLRRWRERRSEAQG